MDKIWYRNPSK